MKDKNLVEAGANVLVTSGYTDYAKKTVKTWSQAVSKNYLRNCCRHQWKANRASRFIGGGTRSSDLSRGCSKGKCSTCSIVSNYLKNVWTTYDYLSMYMLIPCHQTCSITHSWTSMFPGSSSILLDLEKLLLLADAVQNQSLYRAAENIRRQKY